MKLKERLKEYKIAILYYIFRIFPINPKKAVFCNYVGNGFGCNPKYIALELLKREPNWDIVWSVKNMEAMFPKGVRKVPWDSIRSVYELATAGIWVDNQRKLWYHRKRKSQYFVETWHGGAGPIKKIGADNPANRNNKPYKHTSIHMNKIVNIMVSNGTMRSSIYRRAFLYTGEILECGAPRNDILVNSWRKYHRIIREYFKLPLDCHLVVYAPTYRKGRQTDKIQLDGIIVLKALEKKFGGQWYMLKRLHPTMTQKCTELKYSNKILNASYYDDMQELMAGSDVLISDYSSVISEFAIMLKPIFLYAEDMKSYGEERDFYVNYCELPYPIASNQIQLVEQIHNFSEQVYQENLKKYQKIIGSKETGSAAIKVVDEIYKWIERKHK